MKFITTSFLIPLLITACQPTQSLHNDSRIVVKDVRIPKEEPWFAQFATHTFIDYRPDQSSDWWRIEIVNKNSGIRHYKLKPGEEKSSTRWNERIRILSQSTAAHHPHFPQAIHQFEKNYDSSTYLAWPGPNSNTFAEKLLRHVDGVSANLDHNAIGKEHGFHIGLSASGRSFEIQTPILGTAIGPTDGLEISILGFSGGFSIYPPTLKIPFIQNHPAAANCGL